MFGFYSQYITIASGHYWVLQPYATKNVNIVTLRLIYVGFIMIYRDDTLLHTSFIPIGWWVNLIVTIL